MSTACMEWHIFFLYVPYMSKGSSSAMGQGLALCGDRHPLFVPPPSLAGGVRTPLREPLTHTLSPIYSATQFVFSQFWSALEYAE